MLRSPAIDISRDIQFPEYPKHKVLLFAGRRKLLVLPREVVVVHGALVNRKLTFEEDIVCATYTSFQNGAEQSTNALVVVLKNSAHVYYAHGNSHIVSIPFPVRSVHAFDSGLLLEREHDSLKTYAPGSLLSYRFFTLVDPIGDLRVVTTSSTSVVNSTESILYFPTKGLNKTRSLCVSFNSRSRTLNVYHVKSSIRHNILASSNRRRKHSPASTPNPSRMLEDELYDAILPPFTAQQSISLNMDKKRTSTLLSGVSSMARMGSESGFSESAKPNSNMNVMELGAVRKDMIWTKIDTFSVKARRSHLSVCCVVCDDKEAVVVSNRSSGTVSVYIYRLAATSQAHVESTLEFNAQHVMALDHPEFPGWLVVLENDASLHLAHPILGLKSPPVTLSGRLPPISAIADTFDNLVALRSGLESRKTFYINLVLEPQNGLVSTCLKAWKYLSGSKISENVWVIWRAALMLEDSKDEWNAYVMTLLSLIYPFEDAKESASVDNEITRLIANARVLHREFNIDYSFYDLLPYIVVSLHLIYEETRLDYLAKGSLNKLGTLLTQLTAWMGWSDQWTSYYMIDHQYIDTSVKLLSVLLVYQPPNIFEYLISLFESKNLQFLQFSQLVEESDDVNRSITPRICFVTEVFKLFSSARAGPNEVVKTMTDFGLSSSDLDTFPPGIAVPLKNCLSACQEHPNFEWNNAILDLVGRRDLSMLLQSEAHGFDKSSSYTPASYGVNDANSVVASILAKPDTVLAWDGQSEADRIKVTKLIFDKDRRYFEITSLLHQTRVQTATLVASENTSEYDLTIMKREIAAMVALRTLTIPLGRAALFYGGRVPLLTEKFPIPKFNLNTLVAPSMSTIVLEEGSLNSRITEWGHFHNGVSSGLSISPESTGIQGSWVIFNKPAENNAQHAGFLLGLGLNGHLRRLEEWHIYNYLGPKHPLTSVGLLIGMAASLRGSMDNKLTKVLSVHAVALLPQGANDLNVPTVVQSAGLIGIGLLYLETQHRRMSEILLSQFSSYSSHVDDHEEQESYRLAAGIALGFINLGKGDDLRGLNDTGVVDRLLSFAVAMKDSHTMFESDKSGSGAILALGFIYMKTKNEIIANKLQIPMSEQLLDYIRPDLLLLRCLSKNLILWDNIKSTRKWVESEIPEVLRQKHDIHNIKSLDSDQIALFNILNGTCLSLAIKFASTQNMQARDTLLYYLDIVMAICSAPTSSYDQKIASSSACQLQNSLALSVSIVMSGSGDLEVFRRLRVLHGRITKTVDFGSHMAFSMALGILFLGGSQYGFADSNFAIAALVVSLYPLFPNEHNEHEVHLQALRHFWALSVEPRCLVVRDVKDGSPVKVPVKISYKNGKTKEAHSPLLLSNMHQILSIEVKSKEHFNVTIDFSVNSEYLEKFQKSLTIHVLKKRNYEMLKASVSTLLENRSMALQVANGEKKVDDDLIKLLKTNLMTPIDSFIKEAYLHENSAAAEDGSTSMSSGLSIFNIVDSSLELSLKAKSPETIDDIWNLRLLFAYTDRLLNDEFYYLEAGFVEQLKQAMLDFARTG